VAIHPIPHGDPAAHSGADLVSVFAESNAIVQTPIAFTSFVRGRAEQRKSLRMAQAPQVVPFPMTQWLWAGLQLTIGRADITSLPLPIRQLDAVSV
jgi:hypothetical protein